MKRQDGGLRRPEGYRQIAIRTTERSSSAIRLLPYCPGAVQRSRKSMR
jgi:hypothetical protein